jgi:hypothetical protein
MPSTHTLPAYLNGSINTAGGSIKLYNNSGNTEFDNQAYTVMIEFTTA